MHRYSIADGIRDGNVLGFDPYQCLAYSDTKLKKEIALYIAGAKGVDTMDEKQQNTYDKIMQENMVQIEERITSNMNIYGDQFKRSHQGYLGLTRDLKCKVKIFCDLCDQFYS